MVANSTAHLLSMNEQSLLLWMGQLKGIALCGADRDFNFANLLQYCLPLLSQTLSTHASSEVFLRAIVQLLNVIIVRHLCALRPMVCTTLYTFSSVTIHTLATQLAIPLSSISAVRKEEEIFRCELLSDVLLLLCNLGTKEYVVHL